MNKETQFMFEKVKAGGDKIVSSPEELATYYRAGRIHGDLLEYIKTDVAKYGYTLCTHHSSINGEDVWYFSPEARLDDDMVACNVCGNGRDFS